MKFLSLKGHKNCIICSKVKGDLKDKKKLFTTFFKVLSLPSTKLTCDRVQVTHNK